VSAGQLTVHVAGMGMGEGEWSPPHRGLTLGLYRWKLWNIYVDSCCELFSFFHE